MITSLVQKLYCTSLGFVRIHRSLSNIPQFTNRIVMVRNTRFQLCEFLFARLLLLNRSFPDPNPLWYSTDFFWAWRQPFVSDCFHILLPACTFAWMGVWINQIKPYPTPLFFRRPTSLFTLPNSSAPCFTLLVRSFHRILLLLSPHF